LRAEGLQVTTTTIRNFSTHRARLRAKPTEYGKIRQTGTKPKPRKFR
jgi:hypothetical protein